jgi:hypothetical protein
VPIVPIVPVQLGRHEFYSKIIVKGTDCYPISAFLDWPS